jgi:hypothetical protein
MRTIAFLALFILGAVSASAAVDKFGCDDRVTNPTTKYQTGTAEAASDWTLTDDQGGWTTNELAGYILQADSSVDRHWLIKSNTATVITVYGDSSGEETCYREVDQENDGSEGYAIYDRWSVQKIGGRWWLFGPMGNSFWGKSLNEFGGGVTRIGNDVAGNTFTQNIMAKYPSASGYYTALQDHIPAVQDMGFNCLGSITEYSYLIPNSGQPGKSASDFMPFVAQVRISALTLGNTDSFSPQGAMWDAYDPDFQADIENSLQTESGSKVDGYRYCERAWWNVAFLENYRYPKYGVPANPWHIGWDWDEEPAWCRGESTNHHLGYYILTSPAASFRKQAAVTYLQTQYSTISELNTAWGDGTYSSWADLQSDEGTKTDPLLDAEPFCQEHGRPNNIESNITMREDMDGVAEDFWRQFCKEVSEALDNITAVHILNFGPGYHGWRGYEYNDGDGAASREYIFRGSVSADQSTAYLDVVLIGDPMHSPHDTKEPDTFENVRAELNEYYTFHGRPYWPESCWFTAEADSGVTFTGTIDSRTATVLNDSDHDFRTANGWTTALNSGNDGMYILPDITVSEANRLYFRITAGGCADGSLTVNHEEGPANNWVNDSTPDLTAACDVGDTYVLISSSTMGNDMFAEGAYELYIPLTQEDRAARYVKALDDLYNYQASNGDYIMLGYSHFGPFDFSFRSEIIEIRNWGFWTVKLNEYDGVEATEANGETQDCGNFTGPVKAKLARMYDEVQVPSISPTSLQVSK